MEYMSSSEFQLAQMRNIDNELKFYMSKMEEWKYILHTTKRKEIKVQVLDCFKRLEKHIEFLLTYVDDNFGLSARRWIENKYDYDFALIRTYATGKVYDDNNNNIFEC